MSRPSVPYPKTENLFKRDPVTHKLTDELRRPEFGLVKSWELTEKVDGTNMRVFYDPKVAEVEVRGRSDNAQLALDLVDRMLEDFSYEKLSSQFDEYLGEEQIQEGTTVTIYGEGYGPGIQRGGVYADEKRFIVFDICYHRFHGLESWCQPSTVRMICKELGVMYVPVLAKDITIDEVFDEVHCGVYSPLAVYNRGKPAVETPVLAEGVVARTDPYLYDEQGRRIMFKLKGRDL